MKSSKVPRLEAEKIWKELEPNFEGVEKLKVCGSIRRKEKFVSDIDVVVLPSNLSLFTFSVKEVLTISANGNRKIRGIINGIQLDFQICHDPDEFGAACLYLTGSKYFNIRMRKVCSRKGWKLNEYGLWDSKENRIAVTEAEILEKTGFGSYLNPESRKR